MGVVISQQLAQLRLRFQRRGRLAKRAISMRQGLGVDDCGVSGSSSRLAIQPSISCCGGRPRARVQYAGTRLPG
jgi:hypothetical protein